MLPNHRMYLREALHLSFCLNSFDAGEMSHEDCDSSHGEYNVNYTSPFVKCEAILETRKPTEEYVLRRQTSVKS